MRLSTPPISPGLPSSGVWSMVHSFLSIISHPMHMLLHTHLDVQIGFECLRQAPGLPSLGVSWGSLNCAYGESIIVAELVFGCGADTFVCCMIGQVYASIYNSILRRNAEKR